ncbi:recombinase A [uncultured Caudovirales phage]|uniref:Recombinase A n=1 Tax=uncultured Caudovirales phage TaxID=2100421 RepID=A0A6J5P973_9CAUD|nr:recombinase A [uncultured Caudovirales phage]CAB4170745.1 recombinase A [uncultured Caudovirales phage]CAB4177062.1 recombinase A [uncultured Caudovirales phage]CAB4223144.1 recombinase A [uncultured Caudovirales phage]
MSILDKLKSNSTIKDASVLSASKYFNKKDMITTSIPAINIALSGRLDGGFTPGLTLWCGPSKHFKSMFSLIMAKSYMDKYPDAVMVFYDCEFGTPEAYFTSLDMDTSRILHVPVMNMEEFKFDCIKQLESLTRGDRVIFVVDSLGNMSSKKEMDDALDGKSVADMSRAKQMKSIFRMITPYLNRLDIPMVAVNHIYMEQGLYPKAIVSGGTGVYLSSDTIFIIGRQQEKEGTEVIGYNFVINIEKSRTTREKSKIPITVKHEGGISRWSGLLEMAISSGHVMKPSNGWYSRVNTETGVIEDKKWRIKDTDSKEFWAQVITDVTFQDWVKATYQVTNGDILSDDDINEELELIED